MPDQKRRLHPLLIGLYALGFLLSAALLTEELLYSQNTLLLNDNWIATKRKLNVGVIGSDEILVARPTLAGNQLDLGPWYGFQEVLTKKTWEFEQVRFKFRVPEHSYVDFIFEKTESGFSGIRISNRDESPSMFYKSNPQRKFISSSQIPLQKPSSGWHLAKVSANFVGVFLEIDRQKPILISPRPLRGGSIGFFSGYHGAQIDNVEISDVNGDSLHDSFRNSRSFLLLMAIHAILLAAVMELLSWFLFRRQGVFAVKSFHLRILMIYLFSSVVFILYLFDFNFWSKVPFQPGLLDLETGKIIPQPIGEKARLHVFQEWARVAGIAQNLKSKIASDKYPLKRIYGGPIYCAAETGGCKKYSDSELPIQFSLNKKCQRIVFLGTSQTIGGGAENLEETFYSQLHVELSKSLKPHCLETLNLAVSGGTIDKLAKTFSEGLSKFKPDLILINLSYNDRKEDLEKHLPNLISDGQKIGSKVFLIEEASSVEFGNWPTWLTENHQFLRLTGVTFNVPTLGLHSFMSRPEVMSSGAIWWDHVHMSSYGQTVMAEWLKPIVLEELQSRRKARKGAKQKSQN